jgi:hypothetical protein
MGGLPCLGLGRRWNPELVAESLDRAGDCRMASKSSRFEKDMERMDPGQVLYEGFAEALGYSKNKQPFIRLARSAPLKQIEEILTRNVTDHQLLNLVQAFLSGRAGLLPFQRSFSAGSNSFPEVLERLWLDFPQIATVSPGGELFKVRPGNYPVRRIAGLSGVLYCFRTRGWLGGLLDLVRQAPHVRAENTLESALMISSGGYWDDHYDFGPSGAASLKSNLIGRERAAEIIINVLLPFTLAWSGTEGETFLGERARRIFHQYRRLESNSIERHMLQQFDLSSRLVNTACRQQGLLHIYHTLCTQGRCRECEYAG